MKVHLIRELGHGASGKVYEGYSIAGKETRTKDEKMAVKTIPCNKGVPVLMEASILSSIVHPHISHAIAIHTDDKNLYLATELAQSDLVKRVRYNKNGSPPSIEQLKRWTFEIVSAVACLHQEKIIHADIKPSNILIYKILSRNNVSMKQQGSSKLIFSESEDLLKLTDFTLSLFGRDEMDKIIYYKQKLGTPRYRAPEIWLEGKWSFPVDIWSLGCTLYEIAYGVPLFNGILNQTQIMGLYRYWCENGPEGRQQTPLELSNYQNFNMRISEVFYASEMEQFNNFIIPMLRIKQENRPTIFDCLNHSYIKEFTSSSYDIISPPIEELETSVFLNVSRILEDITKDYSVINRSIRLYSQMKSIKFSEPVTLTTHLIVCVFIAHKLLYRRSVELQIDQKLLYRLERCCLEYLSFCLI